MCYTNPSIVATLMDFLRLILGHLACFFGTFEAVA
jgi:hypothetical protein